MGCTKAITCKEIGISLSSIITPLQKELALPLHYVISANRFVSLLKYVEEKEISEQEVHVVLATVSRQNEQGLVVKTVYSNMLILRYFRAAKAFYGQIKTETER